MWLSLPPARAGHSPDDYRTESLSCTVGSRAGNAVTRVSFVLMMLSGYEPVHRLGRRSLRRIPRVRARSRFRRDARESLTYERRSGNFAVGSNEI